MGNMPFITQYHTHSFNTLYKFKDSHRTLNHSLRLVPAAELSPELDFFASLFLSRKKVEEERTGIHLINPVCSAKSGNKL